jgi:hypothetical protein
MPPLYSPASGTCHKCNDSGIVVLRASTGRYAGPGPLPEGVGGYVEASCRECPDTCPHAIAQWVGVGEREDNWFQRAFDSDKAFAMRPTITGEQNRWARNKQS